MEGLGYAGDGGRDAMETNAETYILRKNSNFWIYNKSNIQIIMRQFWARNFDAYFWSERSELSMESIRSTVITPYL